jgi:hypothetical protein
MSKWNIKAKDFRQWVIDADDEHLQDFIDEIESDIISLEQDDFFGTEGLNKRFS